ncbi:MAG: hypothetical protein ACJAVI_003880 [Candidatus Azotimanducaceae bacterium]|jgi:hypothetical protein
MDFSAGSLCSNKTIVKLVVIYGQEATGKLTIAKSLAAATSLKLFHNHVSIDVANTLFKYGEQDCDDLVLCVRLLVMEAAAKSDIAGLIFTWAYTHPECFAQLQAILETVAPYNSVVHFVHVHCSQYELEMRQQSWNRTLAGKIDSVAGLHKQQKRKNCIEIPNSNSLVLKNSRFPPEAAGRLIIEEFGLNT